MTRSRADEFAPGDFVQSILGRLEAFNANPALLQKLPALDLPPEVFLGVAAPPGLTAYVGLLRIVKVKSDEVVFSLGFCAKIGVDNVINYEAEADLCDVRMKLI